MDRVVASYTPTIRSLLNARRAHKHAAPVDVSLVVIALPHTPGHEELPEVTDEVRHIALALANRPYTQLLDDQATRVNVMEALTCHTWVHFSCHGNQNLQTPTDSGLILYDTSLTIGDLSSHAHRGELVFLSACKTHAANNALPDEAITLAAALQYAGWHRVIATLWNVADTTASSICQHFYASLLRGDRPSAEMAAHSLHHATRIERDRNVHRPSNWAPFAHVGL
jgi:CHAT domain-containing protein